MTRAVILCGGKGTRMREETEFRPKPLVPIGGHPILWHIMQTYAHHGVRDFVLCLGYKGTMIKEYFLNYEAFTHDLTVHVGNGRAVEIHPHAEGYDQFNVTLADTGDESMTGGRIRRIRRYLGEETFMVTYGDAVSDIDITELMAFHRRHGRLATVSCVRPTSRFGTLALGHGARVEMFNEKPRLEGWVNAGFFVFEPGVLEYLAADDTILEQGPLEQLAKDGELRAYRHEGVWYPMDTYREVLMLNDMWDRGAAAWRVHS